jgi:hypothetical protein
MTGQPCLDRLVEHNLGVLMPRPAQGHHEDPRPERNAGLVCEHRPGAEVHLYGVCWCPLKDRRRGDASLGLQMQKEAAYRRIAAAVTVVALQRAEDRCALYVGIEPALQQVAKRLKRGDATARQLRIAAEDASEFGVIW